MDGVHMGMGPIRVAQKGTFPTPFPRIGTIPCASSAPSRADSWDLELTGLPGARSAVLGRSSAGAAA